jgi:hypothetical protein
VIKFDIPVFISSFTRPLEIKNTPVYETIGLYVQIK